MASCDACGTTIVFGGVKTEGFLFCGKKCAEKSTWLKSALAVSQDRVDAMSDEIFNSTCPICGGPGPVDLRYVYKIHSFFIVTLWNSNGILCCGKCGRKKQLGGVAHCALLGWWGFPNGLLRTPFMIGANIKGIAASRKDAPSAALKRHARLKLAGQSPPVAGISPYSREPGAFI